MKKITIETIEHKDVRGNKLLYLKISNGNTDILINVGQKTFDSVKAITSEKEEKTEEQKKGGK